MSQELLSKIDSNHINTISSLADEPQWLNEYRKTSLTLYNSLPLEVSPLYNKYTDAKKLDPEKIHIATSSTAKTVPSFLNKRLEELTDKPCIVQIGTNTHHTHIPDKLADTGLIITPIHKAIQDYPELVKSAFESLDSNQDKFTALNNAAFNSGMFIHIPKNLILDQPIHLLTCLSEDGQSAISRNVIMAGKNSKGTIVQEVYSPKSKDMQQAYLETLNVTAEANSHLDVTTLQMMDQNSVNFSTRRVDIAQDATVNWYSGLFGANLSRYKIDYYLNQTGATANDSEVVFGNDQQSFDIQTSVNHQDQATEARVVEKSILRDKSKSLFKGMIRIMENATKSNSFLSGRSILLDKDAKSDSIPGLEIFTNDVKATHSASVAQIDEEQIFYLKTRCLSHQEAERTIVEGFLEPLSRKMSFQVRAWIAYLIESKWDNRELSINTDEELTKFIEVEETRYNEDAEIEQHYKYR